MGVTIGLVVSFLGGLIQAARGTAGGRGTRPLKRAGCAAKAASRAIARCAVSAADRPWCTVSGGIKAMPGGRGLGVYHGKKFLQCARASSIEPKRSGKSGRYFRVLN